MRRGLDGNPLPARLIPVGDAYIAQDVAQEAFVDAFLGLEKLREPAAFAGWFRRIVFKQADRVRRRPSPQFEALDMGEVPDSSPGPEARVSAAQQGDSIGAVVDRLPEHERVVVMLFYAADQSHAEIGEHWVLPRSTVKKRLHDARRRMRYQLLALVRREAEGAVGRALD